MINKRNKIILVFMIFSAFLIASLTVAADDKRTIQGKITLIKDNLETPVQEVELNIFISPYQDDMSIIRTLTDTNGEFKIENIKSKHAISLAHWLVAFSMVEVRKT